ncbi:MAG: NAD(P)H:quinone oxidoreductase [Nocardioidaceae bacterium]
MARITVVYYSATGNVHGLAEALAEGAESVGAEVRLRRVQETAPDAAIASNDAWQSYVTEVAPTVEVVSLEDLQWADGFGFGAPTRFGNPAGQLRNFLDTTGGLWHQGVLDGKAVTSFTSASTYHGGLESTILALNNTFYHWGAVIVPVGYADAELGDSGTPYGASIVGNGDLESVKRGHQAARVQGARLAKVAAKLAAPDSQATARA